MELDDKTRAENIRRSRSTAMRLCAITKPPPKRAPRRRPYGWTTEGYPQPPDSTLDMDYYSGCFVYVLRNLDNRVIYVGQTENLIARLAAHQRHKAFETVELYRFRWRTEALAFETELIRFYDPPLNVKGKKVW